MSIEYQGSLRTAWMLAHQITLLPLEEMLSMIGHTETVAPLLDPTAYINASDRMREDKEMLRALQTVKTRLEKMKAEVERRR